MTTHVSAVMSWGNVNDTVSSVLGSVLKARFNNIRDAMLSAGLVQTADTGQFNIATLVDGTSYGGANAVNFGYWIFRFNDSSQATWPVFIKVAVDTLASSTYRERLIITVGTGSNGAGTLTGQISSSVTSRSRNNANPIGSTQTYACHTEGFFGIMVGPNNNQYIVPVHAFTIARTRNDSGAFDGVGVVIWADDTGAPPGALTFARTLDSPFSGSATAHFSLVPGVPASTALLNGDKQLYPHFYADPAVKAMWSQFTVRGDDFPSSLTTFAAAPMYSESRTYVMAGSTGAPVVEVAGNTAFRMAMLWE
jgi:hypothetical protein